MPKRTHKDLNQLRQAEEPQVNGLLPSTPAKEQSQRSARVVSVPLSQVLPDRYQARVILPPELKAAFFMGEIDCYSAARSLMVAADGDPGLRRQVDELLFLGESILSEGQIEPATGAWVQTQVGFRFLLEAGERRYWSLVLKAVERELQDELRLQVIEQKETSRLRQVAENMQREDISAIDLAKSTASLILILLDHHPEPDGANELDYYRQALQIKRLPSGTWPTVERIVRLSRPYLHRHLQILALDDELLYLASLYRLEERRLREIIAAPKKRQRGLLLAAIEEQLSSADLERAAQETEPARGSRSARTSPGPHRQAAIRVKSWLKVMHQSGADADYDRVAGELSAMLRDPQDLEIAADSLEALAHSVRRIRDRRR